MSISEVINSKKQDLENRKLELYLDGINDPNSFQNWFKGIKESGVFDSKEIIYPPSNCYILPFSWFKWMLEGRYTEEKRNEFNQYIIDSFSFSDGERYFIKTGNFSNKFDFRHCLIKDINKIGDSFLEIFYTSMCVGARYNPVFVLRKYIESESEYTIYNGMPLRYEFRYFYDFDKGEMLGVSKYWHEKEMISLAHLPEGATIDNVMSARGKTGKEWLERGIEDYIVYDKFRVGYDKYYEENKRIIGDIINKNITNKTLDGKWSIDIMVEGDKLYLIDMALMQDSALVNRMECL